MEQLSRQHLAFLCFVAYLWLFLATGKPTYLHGLLPTNKPPLPKWGGKLLPLEEAAGNTERSMFPAEAGWNSWEKPINVPLKPLSQNLALTVG